MFKVNQMQTDEPPEHSQQRIRGIMAFVTTWKSETSTAKRRTLTIAKGEGEIQLGYGNMPVTAIEEQCDEIPACEFKDPILRYK